MISEYIRKTRSSIKRSSDSVWDDSVSERPRGRRVSFSRIISVKNNENSEEQFPLSIASDDPADGIKPNMSCIPSMEDLSDMSICSNKNEPASSDLDTSPFQCSPQAQPSVDMSIDKKSEFDVQQVTMLDSPTVNPVESSCATLTEDLSMVKTPVMSIEADPTSELRHNPPLCFSNRPVAASLPPLRNHPNMPMPILSALSCSRSSHTDSKIASCRSSQVAASHFIGLRPDSRLLSQSLVATPLRQVTNKRWARSFPWHQGKSLHTNPKALIPSVNRLQRHALRLSFFPVDKKLKEDFLSTLDAVQDFLQQHSIHSFESDETTPPAFVNLDELRDLFPHLYSDLIGQRQQVQQRLETRVIQCVQESESRCADIFISHSDSLPVVQQLKKMDPTQMADFLTQAHERLRHCELSAKHSYCELLTQLVEEFNAEQTLERERLQETESALDKELLSLTHHLEQLTTKLKSQQQMESCLKETLKHLTTINKERSEIREKITATETENSRLSHLLAEKLAASSNTVQPANELIPPCVGATPIIPLENGPEKSTSQIPDPDDEDEIAFILTPCVLAPLSSENHTYSLRTLFGLLSFTLECDLLPSATGGKQPVDVPVQSLLVSSVSCCAPPRDQTILDCPAVESLADYAIHFFNTRDGRSQLGARLVGTTLDKAVEHTEYILCPYLLLAADLRAITLADHDVEFDAVCPTDFSLLASAYKSHLSSTPSRVGVQQERNPPHSRTPWDHYSHNRIFPSSPFNVIVTMYNHQVRVIVALHFSFATIDNDQPATSASASIVFGRIQRDPIQQILDSCKIFPGSIHRVVATVNENLPSLKNNISV